MKHFKDFVRFVKVHQLLNCVILVLVKISICLLYRALVSADSRSALEPICNI